jgi:hypothetical protein
MSAQPTTAAVDRGEVARANDLIHYHHTARVVRDDALAADDIRSERKRGEFSKQVRGDVWLTTVLSIMTTAQETQPGPSAKVAHMHGTAEEADQVRRRIADELMHVNDRRTFKLYVLLASKCVCVHP